MNTTEQNIYEPPYIEVLEIPLDRGFATSVEDMPRETWMAINNA